MSEWVNIQRNNEEKNVSKVWIRLQNAREMRPEEIANPKAVEEEEDLRKYTKFIGNIKVTACSSRE